MPARQFGHLAAAVADTAKVKQNLKKTCGETPMPSVHRPLAKVLAIALSSTAVLAVVPASAQQPAPPAAAPVWKPLPFDDIGLAGAVIKEAGGATCTIFRPAALGADGKNAIVLWGNGTGQTPDNYRPILDNLASYGFVVAAANTPNAGTGTEMLACLDWLAAENGRAGSPYNGKLDLDRVGASGHSQGGGGALMAGRNARVKATAPIQPYTTGLGYVAGAQGQQTGPTLLLSGGADTLAPPAANQQPVFDQGNRPIFWATLNGASHMIPAQGGGTYKGILAAWFRFQLNNDMRAAAMFQGQRCVYCTSTDWVVQRKGSV